MKFKQEILKYVSDQNNWRAPSFASIANAVGMKSKNGVWRELKQLQKEGLLDKDYKPCKTIQN